VRVPVPRILLTAFVGDLGMHVAMGSFSWRAEQLGAGAGQIGRIGGVIDLVYFAVALALPRITDPRSRAAVTRCAAATMAAGAFFCWQASSIGAFVAALTLLRAGSALFWPTLEARLSDEHHENLGRAVSAFSLSWSCGKALGYGINALGFGQGLYGPRDSFLITAAGALLIVLAAPRDHARPEGDPAVVEGRVRASRRRVWAAWVAVFVGCGAFIVLQNQNAPLMATKSQTAGFGNLMLAAVVVVQMLVFEASRRNPGLAGSDRALAGSMGLLVAGAATLVFVHDRVMMIAGAAAIGGGLGLVYTQSLYLSLRLPHKKSVAAGIHEAFIGVANGTVAPLAGLATEAWGSANGALLFAVALLCLGGAFVGWCLWRTRRAVPGEA
jgi:predicted MFS family arabinose efflux permease